MTATESSEHGHMCKRLIIRDEGNMLERDTVADVKRAKYVVCMVLYTGAEAQHHSQHAGLAL